MRAISHPIRVHISIRITGLSSGEAIKNDIDGPNGAFDVSKPANMGIVEQEQNGVIAPKPVPYKYPFHPFGRSKISLIFSSGTSCCNQLTKKLIPIKSSVNSANNIKKDLINSIKIINFTPSLLCNKMQLLHFASIIFS